MFLQCSYGDCVRGRRMRKYILILLVTDTACRLERCGLWPGLNGSDCFHFLQRERESEWLKRPPRCLLLLSLKSIGCNLPRLVVTEELLEGDAAGGPDWCPLTCPGLPFSQRKASYSVANSGALSFMSSTLIATMALEIWLWFPNMKRDKLLKHWKQKCSGQI